MASAPTASHHEVKVLLTSQEYIRWTAIANRKRYTATGLARWLILEYLHKQEDRIKEAAAQEETPLPETF